MASMVLADIKRLQIQLDRLSNQAIHWDHLRTREAFSLLGSVDERFHCRSDRFTDYVEELRGDLQRIDRLATKTDDMELLQLYCDQFTGKFAMLQRKFDAMGRPKATAKVTNWQKKLTQVVRSSPLPELQEKLAQQQNFELQLNNKISLKMQALQRSQSQAVIATLEGEILALKHRLGSCQRATWQVEQRIEQLKSHFKE